MFFFFLSKNTRYLQKIVNKKKTLQNYHGHCSNTLGFIISPNTEILSPFYFLTLPQISLKVSEKQFKHAYNLQTFQLYENVILGASEVCWFQNLGKA